MTDSLIISERFLLREDPAVHREGREYEAAGSSVSGSVRPIPARAPMAASGISTSVVPTSHLLCPRRRPTTKDSPAASAHNRTRRRRRFGVCTRVAQQRVGDVRGVALPRRREPRPTRSPCRRPDRARRARSRTVPIRLPESACASVRDGRAPSVRKSSGSGSIASATLRFASATPNTGAGPSASGKRVRALRTTPPLATSKVETPQRGATSVTGQGRTRERSRREAGRRRRPALRVLQQRGVRPSSERGDADPFGAGRPGARDEGKQARAVVRVPEERDDQHRAAFAAGREGCRGRREQSGDDAADG